MKKLTAERVRLARARANNGKGITQRALAARSGVALSTLQQVEQGLHNISLPNAYRLADALRVDVSAILPPPEYVAAELARMEREGTHG